LAGLNYFSSSAATIFLYIPSSNYFHSFGRCRIFILLLLSSVPVSLRLTMKFTVATLLVGLATAAPQVGKSTEKELGIGGIPPGSNMMSTIAGLKGRDGLLDAGVMPKIRNELIDSAPCGTAVFIFARASQEPLNMV
jgi:hypothetical protein